MFSRAAIGVVVLQTVALTVASPQPIDRLSDQEVAQAIEFGRSHEIEAHELRGQGYVAALLYTPFTRIAMAARAAAARDVAFGVEDVPDTWRERVVYVAMRWFPCGPNCEGDVQAGDIDDLSVMLVPSGHYWPDSAERIDPIWTTHDTTILTAFGASVRYPNIVAIAGFPAVALRAGHDFVVYRRTLTGGGRSRQLRVAPISAADVSALR